MRGLFRAVGVLGLVGLMVAPAAAQQRGGGRGGFGMGGRGGAMLLGSPQVQEELKVTDAQRSSIDEAMGKVREAMEGLRDELQNVAEDERPAKFREAMEKAGADIRKDLADALSEDQWKRFDQIELQARGPEAYSDPKVQEKLGFTDEQKTQLKAALDEHQTQQQTIMREGFAQGGDRQGAMTKLRELGTQTREKVTAVLTDAQKELWKEMTGEPFEMRFGGPGGPGGRRPQQ